MKLPKEFRKIIAVDFDGTITSEVEWPGIGEEIPGAIDTLKWLQQDMGYKIILWTGRCGKELWNAGSWLAARGFIPDAVNCNVIDTTGYGCVPKIFAAYFIDDRNIGGFPGWGAVARLFNSVEE